MRLFIAEKPDVARVIAQNLGGQVETLGTRMAAYYVVRNDVVAAARGHLLEQFMPEDYDTALRPWRDETLPVIPEIWRLKLRPDSTERYDVLKDLVGRAHEIVHAGDPDREGQLIIDEILFELGNTKPVKRILPNDLNPVAMKKIIASQKDNRQFHNLYLCGLARQRADWLVGINVTRACTLAGKRGGIEGVLSVGRVQTPTLALVVRRDLEIDNFTPSTYFSVSVELDHANGRFRARWLPAKGQSGLDAENRLVDERVARALVAAVLGKPGVIAAYEVKQGRQAPPLPWMLPTLQSAANRKYGYSAEQVLQICQSLYEVHKVASYPRTDSPYLPESQFADAQAVLDTIRGFAPGIAAAVKGADSSLRSAAWNDAKTPTHHGIIPNTNGNYAKLSEDERRIFEMICQGYIAQFYPPFLFKKTSIVARVAGQHFAASGKTPVDPGWKKVFGAAHDEDPEDNDAEKEDAQTLPSMVQGDPVNCAAAAADQKQTQPPPHYTEGTLLEDMRAVHKFVSDPVLKERLKKIKGIGTAATQAAHISNLVKRTLLCREGKNLISSGPARALIASLPREITDAGTTGLWEGMIEQIEEGTLQLDAFLAKQVDWVRALVMRAKGTTIRAHALSPASSRPRGRKRKAGTKDAASGATGASPQGRGDPCPKCEEGHMRVLTARKGPNAGKQFRGCSAWPECRYTEQLPQPADADTV